MVFRLLCYSRNYSQSKADARQNPHVSYRRNYLLPQSEHPRKARGPHVCGVCASDVKKIVENSCANGKNLRLGDFGPELEFIPSNRDVSKPNTTLATRIFR